jgi:hypothetical protein
MGGVLGVGQGPKAPKVKPPPPPANPPTIANPAVSAAGAQAAARARAASGGGLGGTVRTSNQGLVTPVSVAPVSLLGGS